MATDLAIHSDEGLSDSNGNLSNVDEIVSRMLLDKKIDAADKAAIDNLHTAMTGEGKEVFSQSREALQDIFRSVLEKGYDVKGQDAKNQLQKILTLAGLDYDIDLIYSINRDYLGLPASQYNAVNEFTGEITVIDVPEVRPEDKTFTFKEANGNLFVYEHNISAKGNDIIGYVESGNPIITPISNLLHFSDHNLESSHIAKVNSDVTERLQDGINEDVQNHRITHGEQKDVAQDVIDTNHEERITALEAQDEKTKEEIAAINKKIADILEAIGKLNKKIESTDTALSTLEDDMLVLNDEYGTLLTRQGDLETAISNLESRLTSNYAIDTEQRQTIADLRIKLQEVKAQCDALGAEIQAMETTKVPQTETTETGTPEPQKEEEADAETSPEFKLNNPIKTFDWNKDALPKIESQLQLLELLKKFQDTPFGSTEYAYVVQTALSLLLGANNALGNIDGLWKEKSIAALKKVQKDILGFTGDAVDGIPGPKTVKALIQALKGEKQEALNTFDIKNWTKEEKDKILEMYKNMDFSDVLTVAPIKKLYEQLNSKLQGMTDAEIDAEIRKGMEVFTDMLDKVPEKYRDSFGIYIKELVVNLKNKMNDRILSEQEFIDFISYSFAHIKEMMHDDGDK